MSQSRDNLWGTVGLVLGLVAVAGALATENAVIGGLALIGLTISGLGVGRAVRVDYGIARSITGVLLSLFALAVWVFSRGGSTAV